MELLCLLVKICDGTDVQADWRGCTYGRALNAIYISHGSLTCPSYTDTGPPFLYGDPDTPPQLVCRKHRIKRVVPCRCRTGTLKNLAKCLWRRELERSNNFFLNPLAHLCRRIYYWNIVACDVKHRSTQPNHIFSSSLCSSVTIYIGKDVLGRDTSKCSKGERTQ